MILVYDTMHYEGSMIYKYHKHDTPHYDHPKCTGSIGPVHSCVAKNIGSCLHSVDVAAPAGEWLRSPQRPAGRVVHVQTSGLIASRSS
jgi:hypothetical protein